jgi:hypothetical protein
MLATAVSNNLAESRTNKFPFLAASVGGLFHFKPSMQCRLLALNGQTARARVCRLLD